MQEKEIICKVYENKRNGQRLITIPKKYHSIKPGEYVQVKKVKVVVL